MTDKLLIFSKAPIPGEVKTRLIPALGKQGAERLHTQLLQRTLKTALTSGITSELWCSPDAGHPAFNTFREHYAVAFKTQRGADLGQRMSDAFSQTLNSADAAILIGTDCPNLNVKYLHDALNILHSGNDAVLGPARDGGYVLIGLKKATPELFYGIPWGSADVLSLTRDKMRERGMKWDELPPMSDLDTATDLDLFPDLQELSR